MNPKVFNVTQRSIILARIAKLAASATTIFILMFGLLFFSLGGSKFLAEALNHIIPAFVLGAIGSALLFLFSTVFKETIEFNFRERKLINTSYVLSFPKQNFSVNFRELEVLAVSSNLYGHGRDYNCIPSLVVFLKNGREIQITTHPFSLFATELRPINTEAEILARQIGCKFLPAIYGRKAVRHVINGEVCYRQELHEELTRDFVEEEQPPYHPLNDL